MARAGAGEPAARPRADGQASIAGRGGRQAPHDAVQPVGHRAEGVVVERGHLAGVDRAVGQQAVPALPGGGGPHRHLVEPRRAGALRQQAEGVPLRPRAAERVAEQRRADEAGGDAVIALADEFGEPRAGSAALVGLGQQGELERQRVGGRGVADQPPARRDVLAGEGITHRRGEGPVARLILRPTEHPRRPPE